MLCMLYHTIPYYAILFILLFRTLPVEENKNPTSREIRIQANLLPETTLLSFNRPQ